VRVYFVVSEELESGGHPYGDPPEPPEYGCIAVIVVAATAHKARWLAWKGDSASRSCTAADMPNFRCWRLGEVSGLLDEFPHVMNDGEAKPWWRLITDEMKGPSHRGMKPQLWRRDVAIFSGDPSL